MDVTQLTQTNQTTGKKRKNPCSRHIATRDRTVLRDYYETHTESAKAMRAGIKSAEV
jgi:hypothetical protein